jgi:hypothetical protein
LHARGLPSNRFLPSRVLAHSAIALYTCSTIRTTPLLSFFYINKKGNLKKSGKLEISYVVTLYPLSMATALIVRNTGAKPVELTSARCSATSSSTSAAARPWRASAAAATAPTLAPGRRRLRAPHPPQRRYDEAGGLRRLVLLRRRGALAGRENHYTILKKVSREYAAPPEERKKRIYSTAPSKFTTPSIRYH